MGFFGLGKSNTDILMHLPKECSVILRSDARIGSRPKTDAKICAVYSEKDAFQNPLEDILILSPSVRRDRKEFSEFKRAGVKLSSDCELFFAKVRVPVFAVSGSDGKSTVTSLCASLLSERFPGVRAIGNIGAPMLSSLLDGGDAYAAELSSFMLSYGRYRVFRGVVTNITENHLDWHKDFKEYLTAKLSLFRRTEETVLNADDPLSAKYFEGSSPWGVVSNTYSFSELKKLYRAQAFYTLEDGFIRRSGEPIVSVEAVKRRETHNLKNLTMAFAMSDGYCTRENMRHVAETFSGLEHRSELFFSRDGMDFINSSIDSSPKRTAQTLSSLSKRVIIILGGKGKNLSYEPLKEPLKRWAKLAVISGENGELIEETVKDCCPIIRASDIESGTLIALKLMESGDTLLLSPASTSFDRYTSFEQRGKKFKEIIHGYFESESENP